eukprot:324383_1
MLIIISAIIIVHFICFTVSQNTWIGDGTHWWRSTSDFIPTQRTAFGTLTLRDALYMEFDIVFHGPKPSNWQNIFRVGFPSYAGDCANHNSRYPSLWMLPGENKFHFSVSETANCGKQWGSQPPVTIDFNYHVMIHYNDSHIMISLNNVVYIDTTRTPTKPELKGRTMYVYIGTDDTGTAIPVANATLSNMAIVSYWFPDGFTMPPTYAPTNAPTSPTITPTQPSFNPSTHPTATPSHDPSSSPTLNPSGNPTEHPTFNPTVAPSKIPTQSPSIDPSLAPTHDPSITPTTHPTHTPSQEPTQAPSPDTTTQLGIQTDHPIVTFIKYVQNDEEMDPIIALIAENLIYILIALGTCFAICCPVLCAWFCCYAKLCPARDKDEEGDDSDKECESDKEEEAMNGFVKSEEEFLGQEEAAGHKTESSGSSWTIPIKRSIQQKAFDERMENPDVVPRPAFAALGLMEGSGDVRTDEEYIEEFSSDETDAQRERDMVIREQQRHLHEQRFLAQDKDLEIDANIAIYRRNHKEVDEDDQKQPYVGAFDRQERNDEGDVSTEPEFAGHGGMGVTAMDLEEALDDGLSIVPSTGQYEHSERTRGVSNTTEPLPSSRVPMVSNKSGSSHSTPTTIDEEKEIDEMWEHGVNGPPIQHIPRHRYHTQQKKVNWNGNPFIPKHELEAEYIEQNEYNEPQRVHLANSSASSSDSTHEYTDEYYDEESDDEVRIAQHLQMQMDLARLPKQTRSVQ